MDRHLIVRGSPHNSLAVNYQPFGIPLCHPRQRSSKLIDFLYIQVCRYPSRPQIGCCTNNGRSWICLLPSQPGTTPYNVAAAGVWCVIAHPRGFSGRQILTVSRNTRVATTSTFTYAYAPARWRMLLLPSRVYSSLACCVEMLSQLKKDKDIDS